ncbi:hypothetical protein ACGF0J_05155 [Nonomuraea sp. NPDC047897]|uniref:hypothetical protein n=1 Tax=Nonomuraea sp. NPDC047897 TaxID=3364346 RepID=UPI0037157878
MLDLEAEVIDLKTRVEALETHNLSGMPGITVAERFTSLHDRIDTMGRNITDRLDRRFTVLDGRITDTRAEMSRGFKQVGQRLDLVDLRFEQIDGRFEKVEQRLDQMDRRFEKVEQRLDRMDARFEKVEQRLDRMDARFEQIDTRFEQIDARFEQIDARFEQIDTRFEQIDARFEKVEGDIAELKVGMTDIKSMLVSLGAKAPAQA